MGFTGRARKKPWRYASDCFCYIFLAIHGTASPHRLAGHAPCATWPHIVTQRFRQLFAGFVLTLAACGEGKGAEGTVDSLNACVPNQQVVCRCDLDDGVQTCTSEGVLTPCECKKRRSPEDTTPVFPEPSPNPPAPGDACGNGKVDPGEGCDDGNRNPNDGCSASCQPDGAPASGDACPGQTVTLWKGAPLVLSGTTTGYTDDSDVSCDYSYGPDRVYAVRVTSSGLMTIDAAFSQGFSAFIDIRKDECRELSTSVLCENTFSKPFKRVVPVEQDSTYYLFIDADYTNPTGAYSLRLELP
jgi:cysteine-rich repeat protein